MSVRSWATPLLVNEQPADDSGGKITIGSSIEYGGLFAPPGAASPADLLHTYAEAFELLTFPTPTATPALAPTATPRCPQLEARLDMPAEHYRPGDPFECNITICVPTQFAGQRLPLFVILELAGYDYFWPSFNSYDCLTIILEPGTVDMTILPPFDWPPDAGAFTGASWWSAFTNSGGTAIVGEIDSFAFTWSD